LKFINFIIDITIFPYLDNCNKYGLFYDIDHYFHSYKKGVPMNKNKLQFFRMAVVPALLCAVLFTCKGSPAPTILQPDELDAAVRETSNYLNKQLPRGDKLAILNIQSDYPALSEYIIDELVANTVNDRVFTVVDRHQLNTIRAELNFQMSDEVDDATAQALGRMVGAQIIISGAISRIGDLYRLRIRALSVQKAQIEGQFNRNIPDGPTIAALVKSKATGYGNATGYGGSSSSASSTGSSASAQPVPPPVKTYKVGDTGPGGGIIFFDKTSVTNGWRYLEAAPASTEMKANWDTCVEMIQAFVLNETRGWRLPTRDEMNWMYSNLKQKGLGEFTNDVYWSSEEGWGWAARAMRFSNGEWLRTGMLAGDDMFVGKNNSLKARAVRQF